MKLVRYVVGVVGFLLVWLIVTIVVGLVMEFFFLPTDFGRVMFGIGFDWRDLPGAILGLLAGIQLFRASVRGSKPGSK